VPTDRQGRKGAHAEQPEVRCSPEWSRRWPKRLTQPPRHAQPRRAARRCGTCCRLLRPRPLRRRRAPHLPDCPPPTRTRRVLRPWRLSRRGQSRDREAELRGTGIRRAAAITSRAPDGSRPSRTRTAAASADGSWWRQCTATPARSLRRDGSCRLRPGREHTGQGSAAAGLGLPELADLCVGRCHPRAEKRAHSAVWDNARPARSQAGESCAHLTLRRTSACGSRAVSA
jgi:hypothetical protein